VKLGIDYAACRKRNENVAYLEIKGFDGAGPWAGRPGFEQNIQAATGILDAYCRGSVPRILPVPVNDLCTGLIASIGAALSLKRSFEGAGGNRVTSYLSMSSILLQAHRLNRAPGGQADKAPLPAKRKNLSAILRDELEKPDPLFCYKRHEGLGNLLFVRSPVSMAPCRMKELPPALPLGGGSGRKAGDGLPPFFSALSRARWVLKQSAWLMVIALRQRSLRRR
jgi:hypothetical protein